MEKLTDIITWPFSTVAERAHVTTLVGQLLDLWEGDSEAQTPTGGIASESRPLQEHKISCTMAYA
jgi:hypothetical protein